MYTVFPIQTQFCRVVETVVNSRLEGGFFVYENMWTCYRRNYFRVVTTFNLFAENSSDQLPVDTPLLVDGQQIQGFRMGISAHSNCGLAKNVCLNIFD